MKRGLTLLTAAVAIGSIGSVFAQHPACKYDEAGRRVSAEECTKAKIAAAEAIAAEERAREIARFEGNGITNTKPFATKGAWEIRWWSKSLLSVYIHRINGDDRQDGASVISGSGSGSSFFRKKANFF